MRTLALALLASLLIGVPAMSEVLQESGALRGFLTAENPGSAYDNWVSHVAEGIASPNYNDYGPSYLDPQNNEFGDFRLIPDTPYGDQILARWDMVFYSLLNDDITTVDQILSDSAASWRYEAVEFHDTEYDRTYYILREQLDMSYVDTSGTPDPADDVHGSFRNGWGVFIFNPDADRDFVMVQVVHPCDDFFAPIAATKLYLDMDAAALTFNGAGREVKWTESGSYTNGKSLSDPSRNPRTPLQHYTQMFAGKNAGHYPRTASVIQIHSYDHSHGNSTPTIISAGYYQTYPHLPLRDLRSEHRDLIHMTDHPVFEAGEWVGDEGPLPALPVNTYYAINCSPSYYVHTSPTDSLLVPRATDLRGDPNNQQDNFLHAPSADFYVAQAVEPFFHVEMDEYPDYLESGEIPWSDLFNTGIIPPQYDTYQPLLTFFTPFLTALEDWYAWFDNPVSLQMPPGINGLEIEANGTGKVRMSWPSVSDGHQFTYEILADSEPPTALSPVVWTVADDPALRIIGYDDWTNVSSLALGTSYWVAVRIRDLGGITGPLSLALPVMIDDTEGIELEVGGTPSFPATGWPLWVYCYPHQQDIGSIRCLWRLNGATQDAFYLQAVGDGGAWAAGMPADAEAQPADLIEYRLITRDLTPNGNQLSFPAQGWYQTTLSAATSLLNTVDFESPYGFIQPGGEWEIGTPGFGPDSAFSGENVAGTVLDGPYVANLASLLILQDRIRPEYGPLLLVYHQWVDYQQDLEIPGAAVDGGWIRTNMPDYLQLDPVGGYTHRIPGGNPDNGRDVFSGQAHEWRTVVVDFTPMYGENGDIDFQSETYGFTGRAGWYLDDLQLVREVNMQLPQPFSLVSPGDGAAMQDEAVEFQWEACADGDPYAFPDYTLLLNTCSEVLELPAETEPRLTVSFEDLDLTANGPPEFTWRVRAVSQGDTAYSNEEFLLLNPFSAVGEDDGGLPKKFALSAAWPNPFNSVLSLRYELPRGEQVRAVLYNVLGQQVAVLENTLRPAGVHRITWRADGCASGIYLLTLQAGGETLTRKLVLLK